MPAIVAYGLAFLVGCAIGPFLGICVNNFSNKTYASWNGIGCDNCHGQLHWHDLYPLRYFLLLKGRCRSCGAKVNILYPIMGSANGVLWTIVFMANGWNLQSVLFCLMTSAFLVISIVDFKTLEIPFPCNVFLGVIGIIACVLDYRALLGHILGFFSIGLFLYLLYFLSNGTAIGGGDVKLMAVGGLILGWKLIVLAFLLGCIVGSVCHLIRMKVANAGRVLAMGPYLCIGTWVCALWGNSMINWYLGLLIR